MKGWVSCGLGRDVALARASLEETPATCMAVGMRFTAEAPSAAIALGA